MSGYYDSTAMQVPPPPSYISTINPMSPMASLGSGSTSMASLPIQREDVLEGRVLALTKENEKLRQELGRSLQHSRTNSASGIVCIERSPVAALRRASEDEIVPLTALEHPSADPRYNQLLSEYRKLLNGGRAPPPPGDFGPNAASYWSGAASASPSLAAPATPVTSDSVAPFQHGSPRADAPTATPQSPKGLLTPTCKVLPSKLAAPPQSSQPVRKVSKKQQEAQAETMTKEAYITHLEKLVQLKDDQLARFEGRGPEMLDSAVQATVWSCPARTQTDDDTSGSALRETSPSGSELLSVQNLLVQCAFTTLRPLTLQLYRDDSAHNGSLQTFGSTLQSAASPQPRWAHRPYALTKKHSSGQMSVDSNTGPNDNSMVELIAPMPSSMRWADEPCDFDAMAPSPRDKRNTSVSNLGASGSASAYPYGSRGDSVTNRAGSSSSAWRGGARASGRQAVAQTL